MTLFIFIKFFWLDPQLVLLTIDLFTSTFSIIIWWSLLISMGWTIGSASALVFSLQGIINTRLPKELLGRDPGHLVKQFQA